MRPSFSHTVTLTAALLLTSAFSCRADRWATLAGLDDQMTLAKGETALVVFVPGSQAKLTYQRPGGVPVTFDLDGTNRGSINGNRGQASGGSPMPLAGPATLTLNNTTVVGLKVVTTDFTHTSGQGTSTDAVGLVPSNAVVIPSQTRGPVEVLLESSADLVTWNRAEPGTYGAAASNRFFRVRALATSP